MMAYDENENNFIRVLVINDISSTNHQSAFGGLNKANLRTLIFIYFVLLRYKSSGKA